MDTRRRLLILLCALASLFILISAKVADLQVLNPSRYLTTGASQTLRSQTLAAERGTIYDRNHTELAMSVPKKTIFVDTKLVTDPVAEAAALAPVLQLDAGALQAKLSQRHADDTGAMVPDRFVYLARKVEIDVADRVKDLKLPGISFIDESAVSNPSGTLARNLLGTVDVDNNGVSGIEKQYNAEMTGTPGSLTLERNPQGRTIPVGEHQLTPAVKGDDLVLTIDQAMQYETESVLTEQVGATAAKGGMAIVTKPDTGEVLAMASVIRDEKTGNITVSGDNAPLTSVYEPGSVMKIVTVSDALEQGLVTPDTTIQVPASLQVGDHSFTDAEQHGAETMTVAQILAKSSNIGTIKIAQMVGKQSLYDRLMAFGFGKETPLGFPDESHGTVPAPDTWWTTSMGTIPIGQGVSATPMQILSAYNTIANRGSYVAPRLVDSTIDAAGQEHPIAADEGHRVMSTATADKMNVMLRGVVTDGTGGTAAVNGYSVMGKTGTARKPQPGGGYTDANGGMKYESTFVGVVPAEAPALSVIVVIDEPSGGNYTGGAVSAPAFSKIAAFGLRQFSVPPPVTDIANGGVPVPPLTTGHSAATVLPNGKFRAVTAAEAAAATTPTTTPTKKRTTTTTTGSTPPSTKSPPTTKKP
ncbi:MAG: peptidoglycan D,D-transpeptidase FtsI family protein [Acidimicrobiales bacterium]